MAGCCSGWQDYHACAVMVSAGFVHLLGTAITELNPHLKFPLAPFLCGLGFLVTLVADHVAEVLSHRAGWESPGRALHALWAGRGHDAPAACAGGGACHPQ